MLTPNRNPILFPAPARQKNAALPAAQKEKRLRRAAKRRTFKALLKAENAAKLIETIPAKGESLHLICNGSFGLWDVVPAVLKMTGARILRADMRLCR